MLDFPSVTTEQMRQIDRIMVDQFRITLVQMMENAGRNLAEQASRMLGNKPAGRRVVALCGAGNNGGGGMVAARHLHNRGAAVHAILTADRAALKEAPAHQWSILETLNLTAAAQSTLADSDLVIDAMIGYGLRGDPRQPVAGWIEQANRSGVPILSLDVPSGLDATSGHPGNPCIRAATTLTLALPKTGLRAEGADRYVGELLVADIGVPAELYARLGIESRPWFEEDSIVPAR